MASMADDRQTARVLWTSPEEIRKRTFMDWLAAHTSFCAPLHHWEGVIALTPDMLELWGRHKRSGGEQHIPILPEELSDIHLGFDDVFTRWSDRSLGLTFKPLRLTYGSKGAPYTLYVIVDFKRWRRGSDNKLWHDKLQEWRQRCAAKEPGGWQT
ncbi:hypothetical protein GPECTOR_89g489 [Gonium pectorale]|uniref:Uncharacterized protein n=1 Tax=Gonium pectorale TaxID=33097 RepID=A0A150G0T9_GONPE|nr:hypothetical protein GPECTOR_89g489 [Gonium pectorale]|eukprot:KXZ43469.1 hypothetical protein GPECTOR_89g489 [Gonium pectorale]